MASFTTPNRHGYGVRFSSFRPDHLAIATSEYFGLAGGGTLLILQLTAEGKLIQLCDFQWPDGLFDCSWSNSEPSVIVTASGDGTLQIWNLGTQIWSEKPPQVLQEHAQEVFSVDCTWDRILSASWDSTIKLWDFNRKESVNTYKSHLDLVYNAAWSPHIPTCFASVSGDSTLKLWDLSAPKEVASSTAHHSEVLSCDWSKFDRNILATAGSDGLIKGWDLRNLSQSVFVLQGCPLAIKRVQFSPHIPNVIASVGYDFTTRIWDSYSANALEVIKNHSEFVYGLDWNRQRRGELADCGWDGLVRVFVPRSIRMLVNRL